MKTKRIISLIITRIGYRKNEDFRRTTQRISEECGLSYSSAERFHELSLNTIRKEKYTVNC